MPEIKSFLDSDKDLLRCLSEHMYCASSKIKATTALGLKEHPALQRLRSRHDLSHVKVVYHADAWTANTRHQIVLNDGPSNPGGAANAVVRKAGSGSGAVASTSSDAVGAVGGSSTGAVGSGSGTAEIVVPTDDWSRLMKKYMLLSFKSLDRAIETDHFFNAFEQACPETVAEILVACCAWRRR